MHSGTSRENKTTNKNVIVKFDFNGNKLFMLCLFPLLQGDPQKVITKMVGS